MGKFYYLLISAVLLLFFSSCKEDQIVPGYVYIPEITVNSVYNVSGSNSSRITNVKVYDGNQLIGVYELPVNVPVLSNGETTIQCLPLIENNGLNSNILYYVFYNSSLNNVDLVANKQDTIYPVVTYTSESQVDYWFEDFDGISFDFAPGPNSNAPLVITEIAEQIFEGNGSGKFILDSDTSYSKYLTEEYFNYSAGKPAFLELNYKNNQAFFFSLILRPVGGNVYKLPIYQFSSTYNEDGELEWNKIYIDIGTSLNELNNIGSFDICFEMERNASVSDPIILLDNVKVIIGK